MMAGGRTTAERHGWKLAIQSWTFHSIPLVQAIDSTAALGVKYIEVYPSHRIGGQAGDKGFDYTLDDATLSWILSYAKSRGVRIVGSGVFTTDKRAEWLRGLYDLCQKHGILIMEDDPYRFVRFEGDDLPSLYELDGGSGVISAGSFSKILAPGTRVGWCVGPEAIVRIMTTLKQSVDSSASVVSQALVAEYCRSGRLDAFLPKIVANYRRKRDHDIHPKRIDKCFEFFYYAGKIAV